jgi:hypothetical protein
MEKIQMIKAGEKSDRESCSLRKKLGSSAQWYVRLSGSSLVVIPARSRIIQRQLTWPKEKHFAIVATSVLNRTFQVN